MAAALALTPNVHAPPAPSLHLTPWAGLPDSVMATAAAVVKHSAELACAQKLKEQVGAAMAYRCMR